jgi:hypothetical protein
MVWYLDGNKLYFSVAIEIDSLMISRFVATARIVRSAPQVRYRGLTLSS